MFELDTLTQRPATYNDGSSLASSDSSHSSHDEIHPSESGGAAYLLGQRIEDEASLRDFQKKLYWMTYRRDLQVGLRPYGGGGKFGGVTGDSVPGSSTSGAVEDMIIAEGGLRTDAGWGCMLRSAQMMLAQTVRVHFNSFANTSNSYARRGDSLEEVRIATWFADFPNPDLAESNENAFDPSDMNGNKQKQTKDTLLDNHHWYSLHQMVAAGLGLGVLPGEWYGPTTACHVLRELNELHCSHLERRHPLSEVSKNMFRVHVATEGCIYLDVIAKLMAQNQETQQSTIEDSTAIDDPLSIPPPTSIMAQEWDTSLLLLLPLRLGIQSIPTEKYGGPLSKLMQFTQSVGMLGGTPRHALWFYGAEDVALRPKENIDQIGGWYGLDPHTTQPAPTGTLEHIADSVATNSKRYKWKVQLSDSYLRSLHIGATSHANHENAIPLSKLDPTLALGYYFTNQQDFLSFQTSLQALNIECKMNKLPEIISVLAKSPNYAADVGEVIKNMSLNNKGCVEDDLDGFSINSEDGKVEEDEDNDEEEYVLV